MEPRVEGLKLRFETSRLQATLSAGVLLGAATLTQVLLPPNPDFVFLLWAAYAVFLSSLSGCISDMRKISIYVMIGSRAEVDEAGWWEKAALHLSRFVGFFEPTGWQRRRARTPTSWSGGWATAPSATSSAIPTRPRMWLPGMSRRFDTAR